MLKISCSNSRLFAQTFFFSFQEEEKLVEFKDDRAIWRLEKKLWPIAATHLPKVPALCTSAASLGSGMRVLTMPGV